MSVPSSENNEQKAGYASKAPPNQEHPCSDCRIHSDADLQELPFIFAISALKS